MADIVTIGPQVDSQPLNDNFAGINDEVTTLKADTATQLADKVPLRTSPDDIGPTRNESQQEYVYPTRIANPVLGTAPTITNIPNKGVDVIAHWYNDFGLEFTASSATEANGSYIWYDWSWNFTTNANYDESRDPLLGWYAGDDAKTLDWMSYWLAESGVNVVCPSGYVPDTSTWDQSSNVSYWQYVLYNQVKNFKSLKYIPWLRYEGTSTQCNNQHNDVINNIVDVFKNVYVYNFNGKRYATFFIWDSEAVRGVYDSFSGSSLTQAHYQSLAATLQGLGFDGICLMLRNFGGADGSVWTQTQLDTMLKNGVVMLQASYDTRYGTDASYGNSYANYAANVNFPTTVDTVVNVLTSAKTQLPHPSGWNLAGSTPDLFRQVLQKAVDHVATKNLPKMVTIYNVSEWAEGGASLQPNKKDGFGYLEAVRAVSATPKENIDADQLKKDAKVYTLSNSKELTWLKMNDVTLSVGRTVVDFGVLANYNFNDNESDYAFSLTLNLPNSALATDPKVYPHLLVEFGSSRIYAMVFNGSAGSIANVDVSVMIKKLTP